MGLLKAPEVTKTALKVLGFGDSGTGKTTFALSFPKNVIVDSEDGYAFYKNNPNIATSSFSVIQPIDRALLNEGLFGYDGRYRRYSADGELVDLMPVATDDGEKTYLVANVGEYEMTALDGTEKMMRLAYLMSPLESSDEAYSAITREQLVYVDENKVLINNEGIRVKLVKDEDNNLTAQYDTEVDEDGSEYMIQVDNNGEKIKRILVEVSAEPEN